jgi:hypothetical protein
MSCRSSELIRPFVYTVSTPGGPLLPLPGSTSAAEEKGKAKQPAACSACQQADTLVISNHAKCILCS